MNRLIILLLIVFSTHVFAQKLPDMGVYKVRITANEGNITAEIKPVKSEPSLEPDRIYNWYGSNQIKQTQGGYSGSLLNGQYNEFYLNKNLKEQGNFDKGLKDGVWKSWTADGILTRSTNWRNGLKQGEFDIYDEKGNLKQKGYYSHDMLNGKQFIYNKDTVAITNYKDGKPVPKKASSSFWSKLNFFKKKH